MSFFFVLSGFILVYVYPSFDRISDIRRFWVARFARLWPVHFAAFLLLVVLLHKGLSWRAVLNLAMINSWIPFTRSYMSYNWVSWAIATEFAFYLLSPFLLYKWERTWFIKLLAAGLSLDWFDRLLQSLANTLFLKGGLGTEPPCLDLHPSFGAII
jgi:peptidoglycan/LPS O-acetylase OafA/YrhL